MEKQELMFLYTDIVECHVQYSHEDKQIKVSVTGICKPKCTFTSLPLSLHLCDNQEGSYLRHLFMSQFWSGFMFLLSDHWQRLFQIIPSAHYNTIGKPEGLGLEPIILEKVNIHGL